MVRKKVYDPEGNKCEQRKSLEECVVYSSSITVTVLTSNEGITARTCNWYRRRK